MGDIWIKNGTGGIVKISSDIVQFSPIQIANGTFNVVAADQFNNGVTMEPGGTFNVVATDKFNNSVTIETGLSKSEAVALINALTKLMTRTQVFNTNDLI